MTQTMNALHTGLSRGEGRLSKEASTRKQAGRQDTGIHHVGLLATNPAASAEFYRDVLGMEIVGGSTPDHPLGATAFLSSRPDEESHEIALFANSVFAHIACPHGTRQQSVSLPRAARETETPLPVSKRIAGPPPSEFRRRLASR